MDDLFSDYDRSLSNSDMMLPGGSGIRDVQDELGFGLGGLDDSNSSSRYDQLNGLNGGLTLSPPANDHLSDNGSTGGMIDNYNLESSKPVFDDLGSYDGVHLMDEQSNALLNDPLLSCSLDPDLEAHNASLLALIQPFEIVLPRPPARIMEALEKAEAKEAKARRRAQSLAERKKTKTRYAREVPCAVCGENGTSEMPANSQYCSTHCILDMVAKCRKICKPTDGIAFVDHLGTVIQMPPKHQVTIDKLEAFLRSKPTMKPFVNFAILETMDKQTESQQMLEAAKTIKSIDQIRNECKCNMVTRLMQCAKIHNVPVSRKKVKNLSDQIEAELFKQAKGVVKCKLYRNWITNFFSQIVNTQNHFSKAVLNCTYTAQKLVIMTKAEMFVDPNAAPEQVAKPQKPTVKQSSKNRSAGYCAVDSILGAEDADTTSQHHSHVFDSKCQICALKLKEQQEAEKLAIKSKLEELEERKRRKELNQQRLKEKEERRKAEEAMKREMPQMDDFDDFSQDHIPLSSRHDDGFDLVERSPSPVYDRRGPPSGYVRRGESRFEPLDRNRRLSPRDNYDYDRDRRPDDNNWRRDEPRFDEDDDFDAMDRATSSSHLLATPPPGVSPERIAICRVGVRPTSPSVPSKRHRPNMPQADVGPLDEDEFAPNAWIGVRPIGRQVKPVWPTREIQSAGFTGNSSFGPRNSSMPMNPAGNDSWRKQEQWRKSSEGAGFPRPGGGFHPMKAVSPQSPAFAIYSPASTSVHTATPPQRNAQHVREASPEPLKPEPSYDQRLWNRSHVIWKGRILGETFDFCCTMSAISNPCAFDLIGRIPNPMNLIARVKPEAMWEFMHIIRKQASRYQIILSVIHPEQGLADGFYMCYHNLKKSRRYAVLDMKDANIKEAYLFYIDVNEPLPKVLLPIDGPGLPETTKASMCIVIIRYKEGVLPHNGTGAAASSSQKAASPPPTSSVSTPSQPTKSMTPGGQVLSMENVLLRIKQATTPGELIAIVKDFVAKNNMSKADKSYLEEVCRKEIAMRKKGPVAMKAPEPPAPAPGSAPGPPPVVPQLLPPLRPPPVPQPQPLLRSAPPVIPQLIISAVNNNVKDDGELQEPSSTNDTVIASTETQSPDTGGGEPMDIDEAVPPPRPVSKQRSEVSSLEAGEMRDSSDDENMEICDDDDDRSASESLTVLLPPPPPPPASSLLNPPPPPPPPPPPAPTLPPTTTSNAMPHAAQQPPTHRLPSLLENPTPRYNFNYDTSPSYRPPPMMQRPPGPGYGPSPPRPPPRYAPSQFFPSPPKPSYYPRNSYAPPPYEGPYRGMAPRGFRGGRGGGGGPMDGYGMGRPPLRPPFGRGGGRPPFGARGGGFPRPMGMMRPPPE